MVTDDDGVEMAAHLYEEKNPMQFENVLAETAESGEKFLDIRFPPEIQSLIDDDAARGKIPWD